jgi:hypothetical protein
MDTKVENGGEVNNGCEIETRLCGGGEDDTTVLGADVRGCRLILRQQSTFTWRGSNAGFKIRLAITVLVQL